MIKIAAVIVLILILLSLLSGVVFLFKDSGDQKRVVTSLTVRVVLSIVLIVLLVVGYFTGQIHPHGV